MERKNQHRRSSRGGNEGGCSVLFSAPDDFVEPRGAGAGRHGRANDNHNTMKRSEGVLRRESADRLHCRSVLRPSRGWRGVGCVGDGGWGVAQPLGAKDAPDTKARDSCFFRGLRWGLGYSTNLPVLESPLGFYVILIERSY